MTKSLIARDVWKEYPTRAEPLVVLRGASLELAGGESVAILGPSGSGKSTLLYILGTLERPTRGDVSIGGENPFAFDDRGLAAFRNRTVGFVFQEHHLLPQCSVLENVLIPTIAEGRADPAATRRARELLERVGLSHRLAHRPAELSGGERQRAAIARALVNQPTVVLADEPTGNLDRTTAGTVGRLLLEVARDEGAILVVVTHSLELAGLMQKRFELDEGRLVERSTPLDDSAHRG